MTAPVQVILSASDQERITKLGVYFRAFLKNWFTGLVAGTRYTPEVARELATSLLEYAALAMIASNDTAGQESDEDTEARCLHAVQSALAVLDREVLS